MGRDKLVPPTPAFHRSLVRADLRFYTDTVTRMNVAGMDVRSLSTL